MHAYIIANDRRQLIAHSISNNCDTYSISGHLGAGAKSELPAMDYRLVAEIDGKLTLG